LIVWIKFGHDSRHHLVIFFLWSGMGYTLPETNSFAHGFFASFLGKNMYHQIAGKFGIHGAAIIGDV